jgi:hypothetical protein
MKTGEQGRTLSSQITAELHLVAHPVGLAVNLVNASTNTYIQTITSGQTINLATLPTTCLTLRAITNPSPVGSVLFSYDGDNAYHIENHVPYDIASDSGTPPLPNCWTLTVGSHSLFVTPFSDSNAEDIAGTTLNLNFTVINQPPIDQDGWYVILGYVTCMVFDRLENHTRTFINFIFKVKLRNEHQVEKVRMLPRPQPLTAKLDHRCTANEILHSISLDVH